MSPNALRQSELDVLRTEIIRRITPVLQSCGVSEHEVSCSLHGDRADLDVAIRAPAKASPVARSVSVRALDAIHAHGQTFGHVRVDVRTD